MNKCVCVCLCIYFVICVYTISFLKDVLARRVCVCIYIYKRTRIRLPVFLCIIVQKRKEYIYNPFTFCVHHLRFIIFHDKTYISLGVSLCFLCRFLLQLPSFASCFSLCLNLSLNAGATE